MPQISFYYYWEINSLSYKFNFRYSVENQEYYSEYRNLNRTLQFDFFPDVEETKIIPLHNQSDGSFLTAIIILSRKKIMKTCRFHFHLHKFQWPSTYNANVPSPAK